MCWSKDAMTIAAQVNALFGRVLLVKRLERKAALPWHERGAIIRQAGLRRPALANARGRSARFCVRRMSCLIMCCERTRRVSIESSRWRQTSARRTRTAFLTAPTVIGPSLAGSSSVLVRGAAIGTSTPVDVTSRTGTVVPSANVG